MSLHVLLVSSVTTSDEPVHVNLGLESLKYGRHFHKLKRYGKNNVYERRRFPFNVINK